MEIGKEYEISFKGVCVKKELYKDNKVRVWVQNNDTQEMAIVIELGENNEN